MDTTTRFGLSSRPLRAFIALFTILVGMGTTRTALGQTATSTITLRTVNVRNVDGTGSFPKGVSTLDAASLTPGPGVFEGTDFGSFDVETGQLFFNGGNIEIQTRNGEVFNQAFIDYRVFQGGLNTTTNQSAFQTVELVPTSDGPDANGIRKFTLNTEILNVIQLAVANGNGGQTFRFDIRPRAVGTSADGREALTLGGSSRFATFTVVGAVPPAPTTTQWVGTGTDNWFLASNWTNGVPDPNKNATIPDFGPEIGNVVYPNIRQSNAPLDATGLPIPAQCRTLTMGGTTQAQRSICRLVSGRLQVYGDFNNRQASFIQRGDIAPASVLEFAGSRLQTILSGTFTQIELSGLGTKRITNRMLILTSITFLPNSGNLTTDITDPDRSFLDLADRNAGNLQNGAQLLGEVDGGSHVNGFIVTNRANVTRFETRTYGNIGIELTFTGTNDPGNITVTRNTAENYAPVANRFGIRRIFGVRPSDPGAQFGAVQADFRFKYFDSETRNLRTQPNQPSTEPGTGSLDENTLALYLSTNSGNSFTNLGRDTHSTTDNYVEKLNVRSFATFTLADMNPNNGLPLPVVLSAFDAKRAGADAIVTWTTATEKNSKGFNVQVSTDGKYFRTLGFVASATANSSSTQSYRFVDAEAGKSGVRYYRLHQVDLDGIDALSLVRVVDFGSVAPATATSTLLGYPNPFTSELSVSIAGAGTGIATLRLTDLAGRTVRTQQVQLEGASNTLSLPGLGELKAGVYIVQLVLPSGKVQSFKVQKQ